MRDDPGSVETAVAGRIAASNATVPLLTILVFSFNRAGFLAGTLNWLTDLLADGKYPEVDVLVSNNASVDDTEPVALSFSDRISQFTYVPQPDHFFSGDVHIHAGVKAARGRYVWLMSDDDVIDPALFGKVVDHLATGEFDYFFVNPRIYSMLEAENRPDGIVKPEDLWTEWTDAGDIYRDNFPNLVRKLGLVNVVGSYSAFIVHREKILSIDWQEYFDISPVGALVPIAMHAFKDGIGGFYMEPAVTNTIQPRRLENPEGNVLINYGHSHGSHSRYFWTTLIARMFAKLIEHKVVGPEFFCSIVEVGLYGKYRLAHGVIHWCCEQLEEWIKKRNQQERFGIELLREVRALFDFGADNLRYAWAFTEMEKAAVLIEGLVNFHVMPTGVYELEAWPSRYFKASSAEEYESQYRHIKDVVARKMGEIKLIIPWGELYEANICERIAEYKFHRSNGIFYAVTEAAKNINLWLLDGRQQPPEILASPSLAELRTRVKREIGIADISIGEARYKCDWSRGRFVAANVESGHLVPLAHRDRDFIPHIFTALTPEDLRAKTLAYEANTRAARRYGAMSAYNGDRHAAMQPFFDAETYAWFAGMPTEEDAPAEHFHADDMLSHYLNNGRHRGLPPHPLFDEAWYLGTYPAVRAQIAGGLWQCAFEHFACVGSHLGLSPNIAFDEGWVRARYLGEDSLDEQNGTVSGFQWFISTAQGCGVAPNPYFDEEWYLSHYPEVAREVGETRAATPFEHYVLIGQVRGYSAGPEFVEPYYVGQHPAVGDALRQNRFRSGFEHYMVQGRFEGRLCSDVPNAEPRTDARMTNIREAGTVAMLVEAARERRRAAPRLSGTAAHPRIELLQIGLTKHDVASSSDAARHTAVAAELFRLTERAANEQKALGAALYDALQGAGGGRHSGAHRGTRQGFWGRATAGFRKFVR